ncbi:hypothetical protein CL689_00175 [Candidatus Saccharibacteria bacterium]|nr:hypothetical protein [Candidatus Saccharibacteria bacterium]MBJ58963.1 hypothetical protein [Candidatus Saccharibacteria bacterium]MBQ68467.1 hypothetical protein [Candidatus Saccharibacteria bacterium]|tara:strand:+ start:40 stop:483 length:444 start_codon:yes stop_codon:yes gene_type:complete
MATATATTTAKKNKFSAGVTRRTIGTLLVIPTLIGMTWIAAWNPDFNRQLDSVGGPLIILLVAVAVGIMILAAVQSKRWPQWLRTVLAIAGMVIAGIVAVSMYVAVQAGANLGAMILLIIVAVALIVVTWLITAFDIFGWIAGKTDR